MVLDDDAAVILLTELSDLIERVSSEPLDLVSVSVAASVDADRVAAEEGGGDDPAIVVMNSALASVRVGVPELTFAVDHNEEALDPVVIGAPLHLSEIVEVAGLVLEEGVDVFDSCEAEALASDLREVQVVELSAAQCPMQRPLGERDPKPRVVKEGERWTDSQGGEAGGSN